MSGTVPADPEDFEAYEVEGSGVSFSPLTRLLARRAGSLLKN